MQIRDGALAVPLLKPATWWTSSDDVALLDGLLLHGAAASVLLFRVLLLAHARARPRDAGMHGFDQIMLDSSLPFARHAGTKSCERAPPPPLLATC